MTVRPRVLLGAVAGRWLGERPIPVGNVARSRRLLRRALAGFKPGSVLVVGPGLAVRQALPDAPLDVVGTSPHANEVTVCSTAYGAGSLPVARWDTVVIMEASTDFAARLDAVLPACRPGARLLVMDGSGWDVNGPAALALAKAVAIGKVLGRRRHRVWVAQVRT